VCYDVFYTSWTRESRLLMTDAGQHSCARSLLPAVLELIISLKQNIFVRIVHCTSLETQQSQLTCECTLIIIYYLLNTVISTVKSEDIDVGWTVLYNLLCCNGPVTQYTWVYVCVCVCVCECIHKYISTDVRSAMLTSDVSLLYQ